MLEPESQQHSTKHNSDGSSNGAPDVNPVARAARCGNHRNITRTRTALLGPSYSFRALKEGLLSLWANARVRRRGVIDQEVDTRHMECSLIGDVLAQ
jgi:hypothetical protein